MNGAARKFDSWKASAPARAFATDECGYPSGMVWCPMKRSGMAILKCAEMQKTFGCGSVHQLRTISARDARAIPFVWPWLRRRGNCPERARDEEVRELRLALTPLKPVEKSTKNPRRYRCPSCGGRKALGARQCRRCWRVSVKRQVESG